MRLPGLDGPSVLKSLRRGGDATPVLFLSAFTDGDVVHPALSAGAAGYLSKEATRDEICDAVAAVARGETVLSRDAQASVSARCTTAARRPTPSSRRASARC